MILPNGSLSHVTFRCHNRQFLFTDAMVKNFILHLWSRYKTRYGIKIFEFIIMDNHCHMLIRAPSTEALGHFMRTVNSQIARFVNCTMDRDSQVIRERYKSPLISSPQYALKTMQYIWLNRYKVNGNSPLQDPYCSASWRNNPGLVGRLADNREEKRRLLALLDTDTSLYDGNVRRFVLNLLNQAFSGIGELVTAVFGHGHTIGDKDAVEFRTGLLKAFRHEKNPWPGAVSAFAVKLT